MSEREETDGEVSLDQLDEGGTLKEYTPELRVAPSANDGRRRGAKYEIPPDEVDRRGPPSPGAGKLRHDPSKPTPPDPVDRSDTVLW